MYAFKYELFYLAQSQLYNYIIIIIIIRHFNNSTIDELFNINASFCPSCDINCMKRYMYLLNNRKLHRA